ncbi:MAG: hypothetical protein ACHP84_08360 [Caulobacterales bacterium]
MVTSERPATDRFDTLTTPLTFAAAWTEAMGQTMTASIAIWSAIAEGCRQANEAYAALIVQAIDLERVEALALEDSADRLLRNELHILEDGTEHLAYAAEETFAEIAGAPLIPLPE